MNKKYFLLVSALMLFIVPNCFGLKNNSYSGKISLIGNAPFIKLILITDTNLKYSITGNNETLEELKNLQGATILLEGAETENKTIYGFPEIKVEAYQLLFIGEGENKKTPWVGKIIQKEERLYLQTPKKIYLLTGQIVTFLETNLQAKVWVTGVLKRGWLWKPDAIHVDAYQIIRKKTE